MGGDKPFFRLYADSPDSIKEMQSPLLASVDEGQKRLSLLLLALFHGRPAGGAWLSVRKAARSPEPQGPYPYLPQGHSS